ncbi:MAG: hypothetical protein MUO53_16810 [Maribacter sp.]|nr:hypothetical protein [Maribacter sp.]
MESLSPGIFVVPTIVLVLVILFYLYFAKVVSDKQNYNHLILAVSVVAFFLNIFWELAQGPLYKGFEYEWKHILFCGLASLADMLMVLILFFAFGFVYKNVFWIKNMGANKVLLLAFVGFLGAILAEVWHTMRGDWAYADAMPLMPFVDLGVSPILQFTVLPWLIFMLGKKFIKEKVK